MVMHAILFQKNISKISFTIGQKMLRDIKHINWQKKKH